MVKSLRVELQESLDTALECCEFLKDDGEISEEQYDRISEMVGQIEKIVKDKPAVPLGTISDEEIEKMRKD